MFKNAGEGLNALAAWAAEHPIVGFAVMGWLGGIVAVLRMYEKAGMPITWGALLARVAVKAAIGLFVAVMAFFAWTGMGWPLSWGYLVAGICGLGGSDISEAVVLLFIDWLRARVAGAGGQQQAEGEGGK